MSEVVDELATNASDDFGFKLLGDPIRLTSDYNEKLPYKHINNFSYAPHLGLFAAAGSNDVVIGTLAALKQDITEEKEEFTTGKHVLSIPDLNNVVFSSDEKFLVVTRDTTVLFAEISASNYTTLSVQSFKSIMLGSKVDVLTPCPASGSTAAVLTEDKVLQLLNFTSQSSNKIASDVLSFSWSPKGKQIAIGKNDGTIQQITTDGTVKVTIEKPEDVDDMVPLSVTWLSTSTFLAVFGEELAYDEDDDPSYDFKIFIIEHDKATNTNKFQETFDVVPAFGSIWRKQTVYSSTLHNLSSTLPSLTLLASSTASDVSALIPGECIQPADDSTRASLPINDETGNDLNAIGLITDVNMKETVSEPCAGVSEAEWLPTVWVLGNDGKVQGWYIFHVHDLKNGSFKQDGPVSFQEELYSKALQASGAAPASSPVSSTEKPAPFSFNADANSTFSFGSTTTQDTKPSFGGFGFTSADKPAFGSSSFGSSTVGSSTTDAKPAFGSSAFGSSSTSKSPFGSTAFGSTETKTPFGSTAFGSSDSKPAFGSATFGSSDSKPAFGSSAFGSTGFGSSGFGASSNSEKPAFGSSAFGSSGFGSKPAFGAAPFGSQPVPSDKPSSSPFSNLGGGSGFAAAAKSESPFAKLSSNQTASEKPDLGQSLFGGSTDSSKPFAADKLDNPFASIGNKSASPFGSIGADKKETSPFANIGSAKSAPPFGEKKEEESPFANIGKKTDSMNFGSFLGGVNESSTVGQSESESEPDEADDVNSSDEDAPEEVEEIKSSAEPTAKGPTSFGFGGATFGSGPTSFGGASAFGGAAFGKSTFGDASSFKFGEKPKSPTPTFSQKTEPLVSAGSGFAAFANKSVSLDSSKNIFGGEKSDVKDIFGSAKSEAQNVFASPQTEKKVPEPGPATTQEPTESAPVEGATLAPLPESESDDDLDEPEDSELKHDSSFEGFDTTGEPDTSNIPDNAEVVEEDDSQFDQTGQTAESTQIVDGESESDYESDEGEGEEHCELQQDIEDLNIGEATEDCAVTEGFSKEVKDGLNIDPSLKSENDDNESLKSPKEEKLYAEAQNLNEDGSVKDEIKQESATDDSKQKSERAVKQEDAEVPEQIPTEAETEQQTEEKTEVESESADTPTEASDAIVVVGKNAQNEDEPTAEEGRVEDDGTRTVVVVDKAAQSEKPATSENTTQTEIPTREAVVDATVQYAEMGVQTDPVEVNDVDIEAFEDEEAYLGSFHLPKPLGMFVQVGDVKYPPLSNNDTHRELEKLIYETNADLMIVRENQKAIGLFIQDHMNVPVAHTEASLGHSEQWRLDEAVNYASIVSSRLPLVADLKDAAENQKINTYSINTTLDELAKRVTTLKEKIISLEKTSDPSLLAARDLPFEAAQLQNKLRGTFHKTSTGVREAEQRLLSLKTAANICFDAPPTAEALHGVVSHLNSVTRDYANHTKKLADEISKLNDNHDKILQEVHSGQKKFFDEEKAKNRSATMIRVDEAKRRMMAQQMIHREFSARAVSDITSRF